MSPGCLSGPAGRGWGLGVACGEMTVPEEGMWLFKKTENTRVLKVQQGSMGESRERQPEGAGTPWRGLQAAGGQIRTCDPVREGASGKSLWPQSRLAVLLGTQQ